MDRPTRAGGSRPRRRAGVGSENWRAVRSCGSPPSMHSEISIEVDAPAALVFALARDVERWSTLLPHYVRSRAIDHAAWGRPFVEFVARRPLVPGLGFGVPARGGSRRRTG